MKGMIHIRIKFLYIVFVILASLLFIGCGAGTSDSGFPVQNKITPTNGTISGILKLPTVADGVQQSKSRIRKAVSNVSDFSRFTIVAKYTENGVEKQVPGVVLSGGAYEILGVPFGQEVIVEAVLGKIILKSVISELSTENVFADRNIDLRTTAQSVLYESIKKDAALNLKPEVKFNDLRTSETFIRNVEALASVLEVQVQDENFSESTPNILESSTVVNEVSNVVQATGSTSTYNHLPYLQISQIDTNQRGRVSIDFRVFDQEGDPSRVDFYYSIDNGLTFTSGNQSQDNFIDMTNLAVSSDDINSSNFKYNFFWESVADLQVGSSHNVIVKFEVYDAAKVSPLNSDKNIVKSILFIVDNRGLPSITRVGGNFNEIIYEMGRANPTTIEINGTNFTRVEGGSNITKVALEYFGANQAVSPRKYVFDIGEFTVVSDNLINVTLPSIGSIATKELLFPVDYRVSVTGLEESLKSLSPEAEVIRVQEFTFPTFSTVPKFLPTSSKTDESTVFILNGKHLSGIYDGGVILKKQGSPLTEISLKQIDVKMSSGVDPTIMEWRGQITSPIQTGVYDVFVKNSCLNCVQQQITPEVFTVTEDAPLINNVAISSQAAFNNETAQITITGTRLSSTSEVRISTLKNNLLSSSSFPNQLAVTMEAGHSFDVVRVTFPKGLDPGNYYIGVKNSSNSVGVSDGVIIVQEGEIRVTNISSRVTANSVNSLVNPILNSQPFFVHIEGDSLASLTNVRFISSNGNYQRVPVSTSFSKAVVEFPLYAKPSIAEYTIELQNSFGSTSAGCAKTNIVCPHIYEDLPVLSSFQRVPAQGASMVLTGHEVVSDEAFDLILSGTSLIGSNKVEICKNPSNCPYSTQTVSLIDDTPSNQRVQASFYSQSYLEPGTYTLKLSNTAGSDSAFINDPLVVVEPAPTLSFFNPTTVSSKDIQEGTQIITFTGDRLFGVKAIHLFRVNESDPALTCSIEAQDADYTYFGFPVNPLNRQNVELRLSGDVLVPGRYLVKLENRGSFSANTLGNNISTCNTQNLNSQIINISEPSLIFNFFNDGVGSSTTTSASLELTSTIAIDGRFLFGLDRVEFRLPPTYDNITNLITNYSLSTTGTPNNTSATFIVPSGLIPAHYDLYLKNASMSEPKYVGASVHMIEVSTPVIQSVSLLGQDDSNIVDRTYKLEGDYLDGVGLVTKDIQLIDQRDAANKVTIAYDDIDFKVDVDQSRYISFKVKQNTYGGDYFLSLKNSAPLSNHQSLNPDVRVGELKAVFKSLAVQGPFNSEYGFGENSKKLRIEVVGDNLSSVERVQLVREGSVGDPLCSGQQGVSSDQLVLTTDSIVRNFSSEGMTLSITIPKFLRPGFWDIKLLNNSGECSDKIDPVVSPFFEQVLIREGAPKIHDMCEYSSTLGLINCGPLFERNVEDLKKVGFRGENFYSLSTIRLFNQGVNTPDKEYALSFGSTSSQILTHTSDTVALNLDFRFKNVGLFDLELTNLVAKRKEVGVIKSIEINAPNIDSLTPSNISNVSDEVVAVSGSSMTGTTNVAIWTLSGDSLVSEVVPTLFTRNEFTPHSSLSFTVPKGLMPDTYGVKVTNSSSDQLGFDQIGAERYITIVEPSPSITNMSSSEAFNHLTKIIELDGEGFRGVSEANLIPASSGADKDTNNNFGLAYSVVPLQYSVTSRSFMVVTIPPYQKPGYYRVQLKNTNVSDYTHSVSIRIREKKPVITSLTPSEIYYSNDSTVIITGSGFLGVAGTPASNTFVELFSDSDLSEGQLSILQRSYEELTVLVPKNKTIGRHKILIQNQEGSASSKTVTVFEVKEGLVDLSNVTPTTLAYDSDFTAGPNRIAFTGKHLQGVKSIKIETVVSGTLYSYDINFGLCTIDPYVSLSNCPIETTEMFPGKYLLKMENSAGTISPATPVFDITIPPSTITNFTPDKGPFNAATKIILSGTHLRRFETLNFRRANLSGANDDIVDFMSQPAYPKPKYIDKNTVEVTMRSLNTNGFNDALSNQYNLQWKTFGDSTSSIFTNFKFVLDSNAPVITGFNFANTVNSWNLESQFSDDSVVANLPTTSVVSGLDTTFTIIGENLSGSNKVRIVRSYDGMDFTVACTSGIFVNSNGASSATSLEIFIPKSLFDPVGTYVDSCSNDTSVLPLLPGVYSFIIERNDGLKSNAGAGEFYFAEDQVPGGLDISILSSNASNINTVRAKLTSSNSDGLFGLKQVSFHMTGSETFVLTIPREGPVGVVQSRTLTEVHFDIPAQTLRGNKFYTDATGVFPFQLKYTINALNSRGWGVPVGNKIFMKEDEINISSITPKTAVNFLDTVVKVEGLSLFGVGRSVPVQPVMSFADYGLVNSLVLIHQESFQDNNLSTASIDVTTTVTKQTGRTLEFTMPKELRPGKWFIFAENDHSYSEPGLNPRSFQGFQDLLFDVVASSPIVTSVTPVLSTFDTLPTTMYITGQSLSGIRTAQLELVNSSTQFSKLLTLTSAPDFLASTYGSLAFTLPQSPSFLIPGDYQIHLGNSGEDVLIPMDNFKLSIEEKAPILNDIVPAVVDNNDDVSIRLLGENLFGNPKITITNSVDTLLIDTSALMMSVNQLKNLTIPKSLFPQDWVLSIENSKGSTSKSFVITERIAKITSIIPNRVPFNARTPITIQGDHFIGAYSNLGSLRLTDEVQTALEEIQLVSRYEIRAVVPEGIQLGKYELQLATRSGINTTSAKLTVEGSGLNLVSITPNAGMSTGNDFVSISGSGFVQGSKVVIGGLLAWNVLAKEDSLECFTPMVSGSEDMSGGSTTVSVYVINPDGAQSNSLSFTYLQEANKLPKLLTVYPGAIDVDTIGGDLNTKIAFKFSEPMNIDSLKAEVDLVNNFKAVSSFKDAAPMAGVIRANSTSDVFVFEPVPGNNYQKDKRASIGFSSEIKSLQDENLIANTGEVIQSNSIYFDLNTFIEDWGFVPTATTVDSGNLLITSPSSVSSNVNLSQPIVLEFNKFVNPLTVWRNDFVLKDMTAARILEVSIKSDDGGKKIVVDPQELLLPSHTYQLQVKSVRLESLTSNSMGSDQFLQLNTVQSGPKVLRTIPENHQTDLAVNSNYIVEFDQSIDQVTITSSNLIVKNYLAEVIPWTYELDSSKKWLTLSFDETLPSNQFVDVEMSRRIKSLVGIPLSEKTTTNFKVSSASEADLSEPVVRFIYPSNFASNVSTDATIVVSYSESIHPVDVNKEKFTLKRVVNGVDQDLTYTVTLDSNQKSVYLSAVNDLSYDSTYRVTAQLGVRDLFGNQSTISVGTQFTVTSFFDNFGPDLQSLTPFDGEEGVSITTTVVLVFNENLAPSTVIENNFKLVHLSNYSPSLPKDQLIGTTLPAALNLIGDNQVRIASVGALEKATYYMVEFTSDVKDQFGNNATPFRSTFKTEVRVDNVPPVITLLTVNDLPHHLNGDGNPVGINSLVPNILVDGQGFTIDIYYEDPLVDGYASGVDINTLRVTSEKAIAGVNPNENLVTKASQLGHVIHEAGHTKLFFPRGGAITFSDSLHTLTATIQDLPDPLTNNASLEVQYAFTVSDRNPIFPQDKLFYLDFSGDFFIQTPDVKLGGELTIRTEFKNPPADGVNDFDRDLIVMGLTIDPNSDSYVDDQRNIAYGVRSIVKAEILKESRKLFNLDPETGAPLSSIEAMNVRITTNPVETISGLKSTIRIGGDNGQELDTTFVPQKVVDRSFYSSINGDAQLDLTARTSDRDSGLGVFVTHLIRRFGNDSSASSDWNNRFGSFSPLGFSGSGGQSGQPIGTFLEDQHIQQYWLLEESDITPQMMGEFHKARFGKMKYGIQSFAKMIAVHVARVVAVGTGANAVGVPPQGYYGGVIDSSFFVASQTENYFVQPLLSNGQPDNNILRLDVDYDSHFNGIHFSTLAKNYLENRVTVSPTAQGSTPSQITNLAAVSGDGVVNLSWNADIDATQYNVYYGLNEQINTSNFLGKVTFTNNAGTVTGLDNGLTYHFFVTGQNSQGEGPSSGFASATPSSASLFKISSTQLQSDTEMPVQFTCQSGVSPPLTFEGAPESTVSMVLIVKNTSTANSIWSVFNFPKTTVGAEQGTIPGSGVQGRNGLGGIGYKGPCPANGTTQFLNFELYALNALVNLNLGATELEIRSAMNLHIIAQDTTNLSNVKITK